MDSDRDSQFNTGVQVGLQGSKGGSKKRRSLTHLCSAMQLHTPTPKREIGSRSGGDCSQEKVSHKEGKTHSQTTFKKLETNTNMSPVMTRSELQPDCQQTTGSNSVLQLYYDIIITASKLLDHVPLEKMLQ